MKIAEFTDSFIPVVDGVGRVVYNYAQQLAEKGHECYVMAPLTNTGYRGGYNFELLDFCSTRMPGRQYKLGLPLVDAHFHQRMSDIELDIIHAHSPFMAGRQAIIYAKRKNVPLVGTFHSKYRDDFYRATGVDVLAETGTRYVLDFFDRCDQVWAVSESAAETLHSYGFKKSVIVMPNGTDELLPDPADRAKAKEEFGLGDAPVFLFVGQQDWKKNIRRILLAACELNKKDRDFTLVFTGKGPDAPEIKQFAKEKGLWEKCVFTGQVFDRGLLSGLYQSARLFVFPSLYDTAGLVVREAAQNGTASVVVKGTGPSEVIEIGVNGLVCDDTTEELLNVMEFALDNPEKMKKMGLSAMKTIPESWDGIMDDVLAKYQELIDRKQNK